MKKARLAVLLLGLSALLHAEGRPVRYALILKDPPLAEQTASRKDLNKGAAVDRRARIESAQRNTAEQLESRGFHLLGSNQVLLNAVYVLAPENQLDNLRALPGVANVVRLRPIKRKLNAALDLANVPAAWNVLGGSSNAGAGVKIGVLDSGIDQNHAGFQDPSLAPPAGFPKCQQGNGDCNYTNNKVIVARSYVDKLNYEYSDNPADTRPDDTSPRDRVGHGTAVAMIAAGVRNSGPIATITGVAPKAWLGNYKIFGSPGVNDVTFPDVVNQALEDALNDGMDIVSLSLGQPALCGPNTPQSICGNDVDVQVPAVENAVRLGLTVVVAAGNDGDLGTKTPDNSIQSPGTAPSAITVGASENGHIHYQTVSASGSGVTSDLQTINAYFGNGPKPGAPLTAPLRDVAKSGDDQFACTPLTNGSLNGAIALVRRGNCARATKAINAQNAGAVGMILYQDSGEYLFRMLAMENTGIPSVLIGNKAGQALKDLLNAGNAINVTLDPAFREVKDPDYDLIALSSSQGPSIGESAIKPEIVAPGTNLYTATQTYDPNGDMYDPTGYVSADGTSFAAPLVAGAAALVKQKNPGFSPAQIKSALVNTANWNIGDFDSSGKEFRARILSVGNGKLDAAAALNTSVTAEPATLSFGVAGSNLPSKALVFRNSGSGSVTIRLTIQPTDQDTRAQVQLSNTQFSLGGGQSTQITARLSGSTPNPGIYEGYILADTGQQQLRIPYLYLVGDGVPFNILPLAGYEFVGVTGSRLTLAVKVTDQYGVPVAGAPVRFRATLGGGSISVANATTDELGIAETKQATLGRQIGEQAFAVDVANLSYTFNGVARPEPAINTGGVVNAASVQLGQGIAPGSYVSIFGRGLSDSYRVANTPYLPIALGNVSVSFDVQSKKISVPGRLQFATDGQVNVQVPWELQGVSSVSVKVSAGAFSTSVVDIPILDAAPAAFEYTDPASGRMLAAALDEGFKLISGSNPAARGRVAQIYVNGLGPTDTPVASGEVTPSGRLYRTKIMPSVTIAGQDAQVIFSGLAPGNVGLYQINVVVPANAPTGIQPVVITSNGIASKQTNLAIQ